MLLLVVYLYWAFGDHPHVSHILTGFASLATLCCLVLSSAGLGAAGLFAYRFLRIQPIGPARTVLMAVSYVGSLLTPPVPGQSVLMIWELHVDGRPLP